MNNLLLRRIQQGGSPTPPTTYTGFYVEDVSGGANTISIKKTSGSAPTLIVEYSYDGSTWQTMGTTSTTEITATIPTNGKVYLRSSANAWAASDQTNKINASAAFNIGGNIMSLLYGSQFDGTETTFPSLNTQIFFELFNGDSNLKSAEYLVLPSLTLTAQCYRGMFYNCQYLTTAPSELPAPALTQYCYKSMFYQNYRLVQAPDILATTYAATAFESTFERCSALEIAPIFYAQRIDKSFCLFNCFYNCTNLKYIKCLATYIDTSYNTRATNNWVNGVAASGTFVKHPNMTSWPTGVNGIPSGWTVQDAVI